jgi:hypothetical protein
MKRGAAISLIILGLAGGAFCGPAFAQNAVGGPKKPAVVGGPVKQASPVVPSPRGGSANVPPPAAPPKCTGTACAPKK